MAITEAMRQARRAWIGSSDIAAILGLSKFQNAYGVYLEKTGQLEDSPESKPAHAGNRFEVGVLDEAEEQLGPIERNVHLRVDNLPFPLGANLDAQVLATKRPVEAKTAGLLTPLNREEWGEEGTDQVPEVYIPQCQVHMLVTNTEVCHLPAFLGGRGFCLFEIPRNNELIDVIIEKCADFWDRVKRGEPPAVTGLPLAVAKRLRREQGKVVSIPTLMVARWLQAKEDEKSAETRRKAVEAEVLAALGDAEIGECDAGRVVRTLVNRKAYEVAASSYVKTDFKKK